MEPLDRPTQAVILAGGQGTRLRPLSLTRPKPMVELHGRPFLAYLVEMLKEQGFTRVLMLLGYLPEVITEYFGDGTRLGSNIEYATTGPEVLTAQRVDMARHQLDDCFLLMYCDNYWPMRFDDMWTRFLEGGAPAQVTVYANTDGYSRSNISVGRDGRVQLFDRTRTAPNLHGVEIGYAILTRPVLELLPTEPQAFEHAVYPELVRRGELNAYWTEHRYYSIGDCDRLARTASFLARRPAVILDRDGVLNERPPRAQYVRRPEDLRWLPGSLDAVAALHAAGWRVIVVSNQAGVGRGQMTAEDLAAVDARLLADVRAAGGDIAAMYHCPHAWDEGCDCRKPKPGMLFQAQRDHDLDLTRTFFIGDDKRDIEAARAAGCRPALVDTSRTLKAATALLLAGALEEAVL